MQYVIVLSEGEVIRTIHPPAMTARQRELITGILASHMGGVPVIRASEPLLSSASQDPTLTQSELAVNLGYTGDICIHCGMFTMKRDGKCMSCTSCGSTAGGCA